MDTLRGVLAVLCILALPVCGIAIDFTEARMITEVNRQLPPADRLPYFGPSWSRRRFALAEYRRLFPDGPLLRRERRLGALMLTAVGLLPFLAGSWALSVWMLGGGTVLWWLRYGEDFRRKLL